MQVTQQDILNVLQPIHDPDLGKSIVDLGFIKNVSIDRDKVSFDLELTTPACPMKEQLKDACTNAVKSLRGVSDVEIKMTAQTRGAPAGGRQVLHSVKNIIAVASGKGGVAKSTTAVNLAIGLQQTGASVGILDADIYGPSIPTMIKVTEEPSMSRAQQIYPAIGFDLKIISIGFFLPPGKAAILRGPMVSGYITQFLSQVEWGQLDYLIIDYPPGTGDIQLTLSQQAAVTAAVVCTTPQDVSLADVSKAMIMFETTKIPVLGVIETMSYFVCDGCGKNHELFGHGGGERIANQTGVSFLGKVPLDPRVVTSGDRGIPLLISDPDTPAARAYRDIAGAIAAHVSVMNMQRGEVLQSFSLEWQA